MQLTCSCLNSAACSTKAIAEQLCSLTEAWDAPEHLVSATPMGGVQHPQVLMDHSLLRHSRSRVVPGRRSEH